MSLIEHLAGDRWQEALQGAFELALEVLEHDRFRRVGSSVDDLRSWLTAGGVQRVKERLDDQMQARRLSVGRQEAIRRALDELIRKNGHALLELMAGRVIPTTGCEVLSACGIEELELEDLLLWMMAGARPFEERMHAMGRSDEEIAEVYQLIDRWLAQQGLVPRPDAGHN
jgi:hypothetical protein